MLQEISRGKKSLASNSEDDGQMGGDATPLSLCD